MPGGAETSLLIANCEVPGPVVEDGLKLAITPAGKPLALRSTVPENPFCVVIVAEYVVLDPACIDWLAGVTDKLKSGFVDGAGNTSTRAKLN